MPLGSKPKTMSSVTFTRQQMMQAMVRPITHMRKQFLVTNNKYISSQITFTSNTPGQAMTLGPELVSVTLVDGR